MSEAFDKMAEAANDLRRWEESGDDPDEPGEYYRIASELAVGFDALGPQIRQLAPYPDILQELVDKLRYKPGWRFSLQHLDRGQLSEGLTLVITVRTVNSYHLDIPLVVNHYMIVPPAAYDARSWRRWLFDQVLLVERHEAMEFFRLKESLCVNDTDDDGNCPTCARDEHAPCRRPVERRPYAPSHGPGNDPYMIREVGTTLDQRTSFRGEVNT